MHKDKHRDIARGVLPSTARKGARDNKRNFHAKHRHAQRQANHAIERSLATVTDDGTLAHDVDLFDDFEDREIYDGYTASTKVPLGWDDDMGYIVSRRRDADKLGPLISWATATERNKMSGWSVEDKAAYFKAVLPDSLQGRHALGHVKTALNLETDEFRRYYFRRIEPLTLERFRAGLAKHLATPKSRQEFRKFLHDTVPVAAHKFYANNKVRSTEPAVDENGKRRYNTLPSGQTYAVTVEVYIPQIVNGTCDDCSFLRNDPLATTAAINRFVDIVWSHRPLYGRYSRPKHRPDLVHDFMREIIDHVHG